MTQHASTLLLVTTHSTVFQLSQYLKKINKNNEFELKDANIQHVNNHCNITVLFWTYYSMYWKKTLNFHEILKLLNITEDSTLSLKSSNRLSPHKVYAGEPCYFELLAREVILSLKYWGIQNNWARISGVHWSYHIA